MNLPPEIAVLLDILQAQLERTLERNLVGLYLRGSLALGDFIPATSDVDLLAVTEQPVSPAEFARLVALHAEIARLAHPFARRMELVYFDRQSLRRYQPGQRHPTLGQGEELAWSHHGTNWIIERWTVREHGIVLIGPDPQSLIDPISSDELRSAVRARLPDWAEWANQHDDPAWAAPLSHKAYVVETMCRALYTMVHGAIPSKPQAVAWALATLPEPWRSTVERSRSWRTDWTCDPATVPEVRRFVQWATAAGATTDPAVAIRET